MQDEKDEVRFLVTDERHHKRNIETRKEWVNKFSPNSMNEDSESSDSKGGSDGGRGIGWGYGGRDSGNSGGGGGDGAAAELELELVKWKILAAVFISFRE